MPSGVKGLGEEGWGGGLPMGEVGQGSHVLKAS